MIKTFLQVPSFKNIYIVYAVFDPSWRLDLGDRYVYEYRNFFLFPTKTYMVPTRNDSEILLTTASSEFNPDNNGFKYMFHDIVKLCKLSIDILKDNQHLIKMYQKNVKTDYVYKCFKLDPFKLNMGVIDVIEDTKVYYNEIITL